MKHLSLIIAVTLLWAQPATSYAQGNAARGEASYNSNCAGCHRVASTIAADIDSASSEDAAAELESFLSKHFAPDAESRADIIAYLNSLGAE